jgi:hypothetical protein
VLDFGEQHCGEPMDPGSELAVAVTIDGAHLQSHLLHLDGERRVVRDLLPPPIDLPALKSALTGAAQDVGWPSAGSGGPADGCWNDDVGAVEVPFASTSELERATLLRDVVLRDVRVDDDRAFDTVTIDAVPLRPRTAEDAGAWALWRLVHSIDDFATDARYQRWRDQAAGLFPAHPVRLPDRHTLAEQLRVAPLADDADGGVERVPQQAAAWWHLTAPLDWGL